ncbi:hypothetical protein CLS_28780 [[Clostridium] cf. saccharolyticum K10]|nr:hypothetical protein CLS_28780 [[Clostridium] cf. saccharolyticum K10]
MKMGIPIQYWNFRYPEKK